MKRNYPITWFFKLFFPKPYDQVVKQRIHCWTVKGVSRPKNRSAAGFLVKCEDCGATFDIYQIPICHNSSSFSDILLECQIRRNRFEENSIKIWFVDRNLCEFVRFIHKDSNGNRIEDANIVLNTHSLKPFLLFRLVKIKKERKRWVVWLDWHRRLRHALAAAYLDSVMCCATEVIPNYRNLSDFRQSERPFCIRRFNGIARKMWTNAIWFWLLVVTQDSGN